MRRILLALLVLALTAAACGDDDADSTSTSLAPSTTVTTTTTTSSTTTTTLATTTTTEAATTTSTVDESDASPLNGLTADDPSLLERRVIAVKIDNHPSARPQSGLLEADAVVEVLVEGGITRFIALFHDNDSTFLGPVRSARPTDPGIIRTVQAVLTFSGARDDVVAYLRSHDVRMMAEGVEGLFRIGSRAAPHNLYADTTGLRNAADAYGYTDLFGGPLYDVAPWEELPAATADDVEFTFPFQHVVRWEYEDGQYRRFEGNVEHKWISGRDGTPEQIAVDVLVVIEGPVTTMFSSPTTDTVGSGRAFIFYRGRVVEATWSRPHISEPFVLTVDDTTVTVPPGLPWITLLPTNSTIDWS